MILRYMWATSRPRYSIGHYVPGNQDTMDCGWEEVASFPEDRPLVATQALNYLNGGPADPDDVAFFRLLADAMDEARNHRNH